MILFFGDSVCLVVLLVVGLVEPLSFLIMDVDGSIDSDGFEVAFVVVVELFSVVVVVRFVSLGSFVVVVVPVGILACVVLGSGWVVWFVRVLLGWL